MDFSKSATMTPPPNGAMVTSAHGVGICHLPPLETPEVHSDEVYCMDYISDMKVTDSFNLNCEGGLLFLEDSWKTEWEKPIQVTRKVTLERELEIAEAPDESMVFDNASALCSPSASIWGGLSSRGLIKDNIFGATPVSASEASKTDAEFVNLPGIPLETKYNCDDQDLHWIRSINEQLGICQSEQMGLNLDENLLEFVFDFLEETAHGRLQALVHSEKAVGIEYDENTLCDVCREGTCEEGNEILFCDKCDIAVHQGCYGIANVPEEDWLCRTCYLGIKPQCFLCPNTGGAMKSTLNGKRWCHVSCVLWVPETSFGDLYKMEPVIQLKSIPDSRWALVCTLCRAKVGACIQCSFKTCAISYHVTCGFTANLEITTFQHHTTGDLIFKSFCLKHTAERRKKNLNSSSPSPHQQLTNHQRLNALSTSPKKATATPLQSRKNLSPVEDDYSLMKYRVNKALCKFHTLVSTEEISRKLNLRFFIASVLFEYWKLKRISGALFHNRLALAALNQSDDQSASEQAVSSGLVDMSLTAEQQEQIDAIQSLKNRATMFVALRQDFEQARNMLNLIQKRERALKTYHRVSYESFKRQLVLAGFKLLPDSLCPPSDLKLRQKDLGEESADEGIASGEFSECDAYQSASEKRKREPTKRERRADNLSNGVMPAKRMKISVNGASDNMGETSLKLNKTSNISLISPHRQNVNCISVKKSSPSTDDSMLSPSREKSLSSVCQSASTGDKPSEGFLIAANKQKTASETPNCTAITEPLKPTVVNPSNLSLQSTDSKGASKPQHLPGTLEQMPPTLKTKSLSSVPVLKDFDFLKVDSPQKNSRCSNVKLKTKSCKNATNPPTKCSEDVSHHLNPTKQLDEGMSLFEKFEIMCDDIGGNGKHEGISCKTDEIATVNVKNAQT